MCDRPQPPASFPSVFDATSHHGYLRAVFDFGRAHTTYLSYRWLAGRLGLSSGNLSNIVRGDRRLQEAKLPELAAALRLTSDEQEYLGLLVAYDSAATTRAKRGLEEEMFGLRSIRKGREEASPDVKYVAQWVVPAVRELLALPGAEPDPVWIAGAFTPPIEVALAEEALECLRSLGLLGSSDDAALQCTDHQAARGVGLEYHRQMLDRAATALDHFGPEDRWVNGVTAPVSAATYEEVRATIRRMFEVLVGRIEKDEGPCDRVIQINLQLFPLARPVSAPSSAGG